MTEEQPANLNQPIPEQIQEAAAAAIKQYAHFIVDLTRCTSMGEVDELVQEDPLSVGINDLIQYVLALSKKGLATINATPSVTQMLSHPTVKHVSAHRVSQALQDPKSLRSDMASEILQVVEAMDVLGGFELMPDEIVSHISPSLVHDAVSTVH